MTHITAGFAVLLAMGIDPLDAVSRGSSPASAAVWWAGPVIGAFNLLPVLPLDGGNVVATALDRVLPGRARHVMIYASVAITGLAIVALAFSAQTRGLVVFLGFLLVMQLQALFAERDRHASSPFDVAAAALQRGDESKARRILVKGLQRPSPVRAMPRSLDDQTARGLLALLPRPLPDGEPWNEYVLTNLLLRHGDPREAASYGAESYGRNPQPMLAATIARAAGALGDEETAVAWLRAAADGSTGGTGLATVIDRAPELARVRLRPDVVALRNTLQPTPLSPGPLGDDVSGRA